MPKNATIAARSDAEVPLESAVTRSPERAFSIGPSAAVATLSPSENASIESAPSRSRPVKYASASPSSGGSDFDECRSRSSAGGEIMDRATRAPAARMRERATGGPDHQAVAISVSSARRAGGLLRCAVRPLDRGQYVKRKPPLPPELP